MGLDRAFAPAPAVWVAQVSAGLTRAGPRKPVRGLGAWARRGFRKPDGRRLLEHGGNSRLRSLKRVVTHREELRGKRFKSQVGGDFLYLK